MLLRYKRNNALLRYRLTDVGKAYTVFKKKPACCLDISENKMLEKASGDPT